MRLKSQPSALAAALVSTAFLGGCMSMSGLGGESTYACKAPAGVACDSVSGNYANAVANNLPSQRKRQSANMLAPKDDTVVHRPMALGTPTAAASGVITPSAPTAYSAEPELALRSQAHYLRLWIKPWEDVDGDLYDQAHVYVQVDQGRWQIDHLQQRIRDASAPLRPPVGATGNGSSSAEASGTSQARSDAPSLMPRQSLTLPGRGLSGASTTSTNREVAP